MLRRIQGGAGAGYVPAVFAARVCLALGEKDEAMRLLERGYEERSPQLSFIGVDPRLEALRSDLRFRALLRRMNLSFLSSK